MLTCIKQKLNVTHYRLLATLLVPLLLIYQLVKTLRKSTAYGQRWQQRFGLSRVAVSKPPIIFHCVSLGEVNATIPLVERMLQQHPHIPIVVTSMTPTGSERIQQAFANRVLHQYLPYDFDFAIVRFLNKLQPRLVILTEVEIWPNLLYQCERRGIPTVLINGRLTAKSYGKFSRFPDLFVASFRRFNRIIAQGDRDLFHFQQLGVSSESLYRRPNLKYHNLSQQQSIGLSAKSQAPRFCDLLEQHQAAQHPVMIAASTHDGEERLLLQLFKALRNRFPRLTLLVIPRHPERFELVYRLISAQESMSTYKVHRFSDDFSSCTELPDITLIDSMGILSSLYHAGQLVCLGASWINKGGHNPLEPLSAGCRLIMGPYVSNNQEIVDDLLDRQLMSQATAENLLEVATQLLSEMQSSEQSAFETRRKQFVLDNQNSVDQTMVLLEEYLGQDGVEGKAVGT